MWLHIYRKQWKTGSYTWAFLDTEEASASTSCDITQAAKWHGLWRHTIIVLCHDFLIWNKHQAGSYSHLHNMVCLTLQRGATSTARHAKTSSVVEQRALLTCCTVLLIRLYLDNIWRKCKRAAMYMFTKVLALLWCGRELLQIIASFFSLLSKFGFFFSP